MFLSDNYVWILSYFHAKKKIHPYHFFAQNYEIHENLNWSKIWAKQMCCCGEINTYRYICAWLKPRFYKFLIVWIIVLPVTFSLYTCIKYSHNFQILHIGSIQRINVYTCVYHITCKRWYIARRMFCNKITEASGSCT